MTKFEIAILILFSLFTVAMPIRLPLIRSPPRPLCASQFNLVNYACAALPIAPFAPPPPHHHSHRRHGHSSRDDDRPSRRRNRNRSRRHRGRHDHETDAEGYCCQWLNQLDTECVCDVLVHLPVFLSRPYHEYSIVVGEACTVNFTCPGRAIP